MNYKLIEERKLNAHEREAIGLKIQKFIYSGLNGAQQLKLSAFNFKLSKVQQRVTDPNTLGIKFRHIHTREENTEQEVAQQHIPGW